MILFFSGCGNSEYVAHLLGSRLGDNVMRIDVTATYTEFDVVDEKRIVWVSPVYSWGLPKAVRGFIKRVGFNAFNKEMPHFLVCTCGDDAGLVAKQWRKVMAQRGFRAVSAYTVIMPNTYVFLPGFDVDTADVVSEKLNAAPSRVAEIAHAIKCCSPIDSVIKGRCAWLKSKVIYPLFMRFLTSPRRFHSTDECVGCGICASNCPMNNIVIDGDSKRPKWGNNCAFCLGCYHRCPHRAIAYGRNASEGKGQYFCRESVDSDCNVG